MPPRRRRSAANAGGDRANIVPFTDQRQFAAIRNVEAEKSVLAGILIDPDTYDDVVERVGLVPADFYTADFRSVFEAIAALQADGAIDPVSVCEALERRGVFVKPDGSSRVADLLDEIGGAAPHAVNTVYHAGIVKEKARARAILEAANAAIVDVFAMQKPTDQILADTDAAMFAVGRLRSGAIQPPETYMAEVFGRLDARQAGEAIGLSYGFNDMDALTSGLHPETVTVIAGRPGMGKTAFGLAVAFNVAIDTENPSHVLFISLEMSAAELGERLLVMASGVPGGTLRHIGRGATLTYNQMTALGQAREAIERGRLAIDPGPSRDASEIAAYARRWQRQHGLSLLVIDYLQLVEESGEEGNREQAVAAITRRIKILSKELGIPIILLSQLNRSVESREDKRPRLHDIRESGAVEQDADNVLFVHRPDYYDPNDQPNVAEVIVAKQRNGPTGIVRFVFMKEIGRFMTFADYAARTSEGPAF